jgi:hypothetical protein
MPKNARKHPKIEDLVNYLVKHILENITVVIITPPLEICQTDPAISPSDIYASNDESRSITPGTIGKYIGHGFFRNSALSIRLLDFLHNLKIM